MSKLFVNGNNIIGKRDVAGIGTASVIHQIAIQLVLAKTALASGLKPSGVNKKITKKNDSDPIIKTMFKANLLLRGSPLSPCLLLLYRSDLEPSVRLVSLDAFFGFTKKLNISLISSCLSHYQFQAVTTLIPPKFLCFFSNKSII